ncbi:MAG: branched-chain amino acid ABC transporter permease [Halanaeroarchaeum sp.]
MVQFSQLIINGLLLSALYGLVAVGFTIIFGVGGVLNLFHGASIAVGAFAMLFLINAGFGIVAGVLAAIAIPVLVNLAIYLGMVENVQDRPLTVMILTLTMALLVKEVFLSFVGSRTRSIPSLVSGKTELLGIAIRSNRLAVLVLSWVIIGLLFVFINRTRHGKAIMATSMSERGAALVGINSRKMYIYTWILASALAGIAGIFFGSFQGVTFNMGAEPLVLSFSIVVIGGIGSIRGSLVGAHIVGFIEIITASLISTRLTGMLSLMVLWIVLVVKPEGLFGRELVGV